MKTVLLLGACLLLLSVYIRTSCSETRNKMSLSGRHGRLAKVFNNDLNEDAVINVILGQPQIDPYYSWFFRTIINGQIPSRLPLIVRGHLEVIEEGIYFDGLTGYLSTLLVPSNILLNPDSAKEGLALGIKLKFDGTAKEYDTPRYVLDTGAKSGGRTGISLYVLNRKFIAELATPVMKWKAEINLIYDKWLYVIVNWKSTYGLYISMNGFHKSSDSEGSPANGLQPSPRDPNFCLGRNVGGTRFYYTKFYLASLVVFREFLPDTLIYPVYSYYSSNEKALML